MSVATDLFATRGRNERKVLNLPGPSGESTLPKGSLPKPLQRSMSCGGIRSNRALRARVDEGVAKKPELPTGPTSVTDLSQAKSTSTAKLAPTIPSSVQNEDTSDESQYHELLLWRLAYRSYRLGNAQGAKGELSSLAGKLDVKKLDLQLLPIGELLSLRREKSAIVRPDVTGCLHVHFGAGRLALGLVLPALHASGRPFAVIQRPSGEFKAMVAQGGGRDIQLDINDEVSTTLTLITCEEDLTCITPSSRLLICSDDPLLTRVALAHAPTMSTALGPAMFPVLIPLLEEMVDGEHSRDEDSEAWEIMEGTFEPIPEGTKPTIYCCENDHKAVDKLAEQLEGRVDVVPCMVDRICTDRKVTEDKIITDAEPYSGSIVVLSPPPTAPLPAFGGPTVAIPETNAAAQYLCRRKLLTVNGMHTTLAFITLREHESGPGVAGDYPLVTQGKATEEQRRVIWAWAVARCCLLLFEHDTEVMRVAHGVETNAELLASLLELSQVVLKRFDTADDTTKRILSGGVKNRWETRLANVQEFLNQGRLDPVSMKLVRKAGISLEEVMKHVRDLVCDSKPFTYDDNQVDRRFANKGSTKCLSRKALRIVFKEKAGVLFDFDGTLGDTETPAMEVAYWELAPYLPGIPAEKLEENKVAFIQANAGKAFEHMIEATNTARQASQMPDVETAHASPVDLDDAALAVINKARERFGLLPVADAKSKYGSLLVQQKEETVLALGKCAQANPGVVETLQALRQGKTPFNIATTSGKPRVPVCVDAAGLREFFPTDAKIHSGESDFTPSKFKPDPDVYLKAAAAEGLAPAKCIAVEDSASGVGSAANANMGLIVGYVGASHIPDNKKQSHAAMLMQGTKSMDGRGAAIVITDMLDLPAIVKAFEDKISTGSHEITYPVVFRGTYYLPPKMAVLFDFDGTLGDTETPAMEVAYWELAPYLPGIPAEKLEENKVSFIQANAGKAFEHMIETANQARQKLKLPDVETAHSSPGTLSDATVAVIDTARARFGLPSIAVAKAKYSSLLIQQKEETVLALGKCAQANPSVVETLEALVQSGTPFNIATTSGKPRVPVCVDAAGLREFFPTDAKIHSGESDFTPSKFKPDPDVYLKAAAAEMQPPSRCIAVEDSASGVGSAANAKMGLIVGYVGASHIPKKKKASHAHMLMKGTRSKDGRGAEIVISDMLDLPQIVKCFEEQQETLETGGQITFPTVFRGTVYFQPKVAVLFDFDGTLGDTETPAMEVAYWELAPYLPGVPAAELEAQKVVFIQMNAGKAFEHMIEAANKDRKEKGLPDVESARKASQPIDAAALAVIDAARSRFGLPGVAEATSQYPSLLVQQKEETVLALGKCAKACPGVIDMLNNLSEAGVPFNIATTSGKPRVPVCVDAANLREFFPTNDKIHSGESDFTPSKFKPDPAVYLKAAADEKLPASSCIAVEDSASGVGSAANAKMGLIVGYVGASHIPADKKQSHAEMLIEGTRSEDGRGADIVITDMVDLPPIVQSFQEHISRQTESLILPTNLKGQIYA